MFSKFTKLSQFAKTVSALAFVVAIGAVALAATADAGTTQCWRCTGGWCCY
jgi:hypothetical protein